MDLISSLGQTSALQSQSEVRWPGRTCKCQPYDLDYSKFDQHAEASSNNPTIVLVHDAFQTPLHFEWIARELRDAGYNVLTPQLPSSNTPSQPTAFQADVQAIFGDCKSVLETGSSIVMVLHGYSGLVGPIAAEKLNQYALTRPRTGYVVKLLFISAIVASEGECVLDLLRPEWLIYENGVLRVQRPDQAFYQDCPSEIARSAVAMMRPQAADSFRFRVTNPGWSRIPCVYVICETDQALSPGLQHTFLGKLRTRNSRTATLSVQTGHCPYLSQAKATATLVVRLSDTP